MKKFMENFFESELYKGPETTANYQMVVSIVKPNFNLIMIKMEGITDLNPVITCIIDYFDFATNNREEKTFTLDINRRYSTDEIFNLKLKNFEEYINYLTHNGKLTIDELREVISKLNMESYKLFIDVNKYNL
jgi:hypothetical protein